MRHHVAPVKLNVKGTPSGERASAVSTHNHSNVDETAVATKWATPVVCGTARRTLGVLASASCMVTQFLSCSTLRNWRRAPELLACQPQRARLRAATAPRCCAASPLRNAKCAASAPVAFKSLEQLESSAAGARQAAW